MTDETRDTAASLGSVREVSLADIASKLRECDREAALRGYSDTSFPRLWFSAIWRSARLDFLGTLRGSIPNDSSILSRADRSDSSPALVEARDQITKLWVEIARLRLTDAERDAIDRAASAHEYNDDDQQCAEIAATLRGLLERLNK